MTQTAGCIAATAGVAWTAVLLQQASNLTASPEAATKIFEHFFKKSTYVLGPVAAVGTIAALVQSGKTPATKGLWLLSGALLASFFPYTAGLVKPHAAEVVKAAEEGKAAEAKTLKALTTHTLARAGLVGAATAVAVFALSHKK